ncbi:MAG TPA: methyltransferase domain-containing protein, partial [Miltoncostaeaceae bacterium]|nr:methyltransferase domain-containing protein [Miltoncostaeaceae bacterium]
MAGPPEFTGFSDVDRTGRAGVYADYLDRVRGLEAVAEWKERSFVALAPRPGAVLLDVGCGTGEDARALAQRVAPGGRAIGVDASEAMVAEARRRAAEAGERGVEFLRSDVRSLALPDGAVDGCRAERVLQHVEDPAGAIAEMARVVRPGGSVVAAEPDWGTLVIASRDPEAAAEVAAAACRRLRSGLVGRALRRLFAEAGLAEVAVAGRTLVVTDRARADMLIDLEGAVRRAVDDGRLSARRAASWLEALASDE